jgi:hypothetical protein
MAVQSLQLLNDNSTIANFSAWASAISSWLATCGWTQTTDTGQVMWTGLSITAVSMSGVNATYTYNSLTGLALQNGRVLTITGMANSGNNGTFVITSFTGTTSGTFTVVNAAGVNASGQSGVVTKIAAVPGTNVYVTEFWQPGDGISPTFVVRLQYGNIANTNCPNINLAVCDTTTGNGNLQGYSAANGCCSTSYTIGGSSITYNCRFSGDSGRFSIAMWRDAPNSANLFIGVERGKDSSGNSLTGAGAHVTMMCGGWSSNNQPLTQYTLVMGQGVPPFVSTLSGTGRNDHGMGAFVSGNGYTTTNVAVNGVVGVATVCPFVGYWDYPLTMFGLAPWAHFSEAQTFTASLYGSTRTYICFGSNVYNRVAPAGEQSWMLMRYD